MKAQGYVSTGVVDSYTGYKWCGRGLHLLTPEAEVDRKGRCMVCTRARGRQRKREVRGR